MPALKLHTKIILLMAVITIAVMIATVLLVSVRIVDLVQSDERDLTRLQAISLAEQINLMSVPRDEDDLIRAVAQTRGAGRNIVAVRFWERDGDTFKQHLASTGSSPPTEINDEVKTALVRAPKTVAMENFSETAEHRYRVFAPILEKGQVRGAVEIEERLDNVSSIVERYALHTFVLILLAIGVMTFAIWLTLRWFVYRPLEKLLATMARTAQSQNEGITDNELDRAEREYLRMLEQVQELNTERERQQEVLRERIQIATLELQQRNEQLSAANLELWETSRRLSQLERLAVAGQTATQFAHEVGTPLNIISIHLELLQELLRDNVDARKRTEIIGEQTERIERIVRQMLDRTRAAKPELELTDLFMIIERICDATEPTLLTRKVELVKMLDTCRPHILAHGDLLQQLFINLINNAMDAMATGGTLTIAGKCEKESVVVTISDSGCGMASETMARIFEPLYTTKERGRGTGIGLVVVKQIMQELQGEIVVQSELQHGSEFRLTFPVWHEVHA